MTRKQKPSIAAKKRPAAADSRKPVKAAAAEKAVAPVATVREKDRPKPAATVRKAPEEPVIAPAQTVEPVRTPERPVDGKSESQGAIHNDPRQARVGPRASGGEGHDGPSNGGAKSESPGAIHNDTRKARVGPRASGGGGHDGPRNAVEK